MTNSDPSESRVDALSERFWEAILELNPVTATVYGDERYADRLDDPGPEGRAATRRLMEQTLAEVESIPVDGLPTEARITRDMLRVVAELGIEEDDQQIHQLRVVDQMSGPQQTLPQLTSFQTADTPDRLDAFLARIHAYRDYMAANAEILRDGMASGLTAPRIVAERTIAQVERMLEVPIESAIVPSMVKVASDADRERVRDAIRDEAYPADAAFLQVLRDEYLPLTREEPGLWSAPNGEALYRTAIRSWTTLELDPEAVHRIGLEDLETIDEERRAISRAAGFGDDIDAYRRSIEADPANMPSSKDELVARATEDIERGLAAAPRFFGVLPRTGVGVRPVEEFKEKDAPFAYYYPPTADGSRQGIYYANGYDLPSRTYTKLATTTYHEAVPGHHFQITLEMENPNLNTFRRLGSRMVGAAFVEGWGLYSERLADEMGLFRSEGERFGMLDAQAWRAARLVVDTGMHALRWSRQQSIDFLQADRPLGDRRRHRDGPLHLLARSGADVQDRPARDRAAARRVDRARRGRLRYPHVPRRGAGHGSLPLATFARELPAWVVAPV